MVDHQFEGGSILSQLEYAGMTSVMELMQNGFPSRVPYVDLYNMYSKYLPPKLAKLEPRVFCQVFNTTFFTFYILLYPSFSHSSHILEMLSGENDHEEDIGPFVE